MRYPSYASVLAAPLLIGSIVTALGQTTIAGTGIGASGGAATAGAGTALSATVPQSSSVVTPGANVSFFTDPLSVGPNQIPPTGPVGSDPLRVGPVRLPSGGSSSAAAGSSSSSEECALPDCLPGEN
jgi:hypothetical protein